MTRQAEAMRGVDLGTSTTAIKEQRTKSDAPHSSSASCRGPKTGGQIACCLGRELLPRFLARVPQAIVSQNPDDLLALALADRVRLVVADPSADERRCMRTLLDLRQQCPATLIVVYTSLRAAVMPDIVELAQHGVQDVVVSGTDDTKSRFDELIERAITAPLTSAIVQLLEANLAQLRPMLADAIREMFASPRRLASVPQLAAAGGMTRRSLYRHLAAAGIRSPRLLVASARIMRAAQVLAHSRLTIREVARSLGFSKPDVMTFQIVSLTGLRPRELKEPGILAMLPELIVSRLSSDDSVLAASRTPASIRRMLVQG